MSLESKFEETAFNDAIKEDRRLKEQSERSLTWLRNVHFEQHEKQALIEHYNRRIKSLDSLVGYYRKLWKEERLEVRRLKNSIHVFVSIALIMEGIFLIGYLLAKWK